MRESPAVELMTLLEEKGAIVNYSDPHVPEFPKMRKYHFDLKSVSITAESLANYDVLLLATNHDKFDYKFIKEHANLIIDTRGIYREGGSNIVKA